MSGNADRLKEMRQRMRASRSPEKGRRDSNPNNENSNPSSNTDASATGNAGKSKLEQMRQKRRQTMATEAQNKANPATPARANAQQAKPNITTQQSSLLSELSDDMLMATYKPPQVFSLGFTQDEGVDKNEINRQLFFPEAFSDWRESLGMDTEKDREDLEAFKRRKERRRRKHPFNVWLQNFNKKMFGTPIPEEDEYDSDDDDAHSSLLKEEGLFVAHGPEGVDNLIGQGRLYSRMKREALQAENERKDRKNYQKLADEVDAENQGVGVIRDGGSSSVRGPSLYDDFFHADGNPRVAENPVVPGSHRPYTLDSDGVTKKYSEHLKIELNKIKTGVASAVGSNDTKRAELIVSLPRIAFYDHPEQNAEERLFAELRLAYGKYQSHIEGSYVSFLTRRINALVYEGLTLRETIGDEVGADANDDGVDDSEQLRTLYDDILETVSIRLAEEHELRTLSSDLYGKWQALKAERKNQGFTTTPARLVARAVDTRGGIDADGGQQDGGGVPTGMKARLLAKQKKDAGVKTKDMKEVLQDLKEILPWLSSMVTKTERFHHDTLVQLKKTTQMDETDERKFQADTLRKEAVMNREHTAERQRVELLLEACDALLPKGGTDYILRLSNDEQYLRTDECKDLVEKKRRLRVTKDVYYCNLLINDKVVGSTIAKPLEWPSYTIGFNKRFRCRLLRRPQSICVRIVKSKGLLQDQVVANCMVKVPGGTVEHDKATTHSLAPTVCWYQFAQARSYAWDSEAKPPSKRLQGGLLVGCEWGVDRVGDEGAGGKKQDEHEPIAPLLPERPVELDDGRLQGLKTAEMDSKKMSDDTDHHGKPADFARERDFLGMLPKLATIDPNDPRNANLFRLGDMLLPSQKSADVFRTVESSLQSAFKMPGTDTLYSNVYAVEQPRRHQLLKLRTSKPTLFSSAIPLSEEVIKRDENYRGILAAERRKHADEDETELTAAKQRKAVDKAKLRDFVKRIRDSRQTESKLRRKRQVHMSEVVQEGLLPEFVKFRFDLGAIADFFVPPRKRGLRPTVKQRHAVTALVRSCRLLITIVGARNVPNRVRIGGDNNRPSSPKKRAGSPQRRVRARNQIDDDDDDDMSSIVQSFVVVRFQETEDRTRPVMGSAPLWKQTLDVPFRPPMGDFSPGRLTQVRDNIEVMLFDSVNVDSAGDGGYYDDEVTVRNEKRFLGNLSIPFSTIYMEGKVEGTFRLESPDVVLGYSKRAMKVVDPGSSQAYIDDENEANNIADDAAGESEAIDNEGVPPRGASNAQLIRDAEESTYVKIMATLEPLLVAPPKDSFTSISGEKNLLVNYCKNWVDRTLSISRFTSKRVIEVLVPDMHGCKWMVTRYLRALEPPPGCNTVKKVAHFVSMIPFLEDWQAFLGDYDMWCTCQQFLDILAGDWEEHATLLANYFMYLSDKDPENMEAEVYLVLGNGIPEGETVYVMRRDVKTQDVAFWNASTGVAYAIDDDKCPLLDIGCIVSKENVWANVQKFGRPSEVSLDFNDKKCWKPLFGDRFPYPEGGLHSLQERRLTYTSPSTSFAEELQDELNETLKRDIRRWRRGATGFKGETSNRLRALLETLEACKRGDATLSHKEHLMRLERASGNREMSGLPLHFSFTDIQEVIQKVKATSVHMCMHPQVDFALAVRVFPYHSNVLSVWVYFAALTPKAK
ncbi:hypothetical protein TrCOL_g10233 [Triparma columacea]|uniref:C2 domain-containing protein n=1 Tax=Triparma columacea TaxID=722753 RepID=A0A9W7GB52_9STRA|nr:hypothetical protein TrCOL_g10233 [Triparma columacea]